MTDQEYYQKVREKIKHEICLPCVHRYEVISETSDHKTKTIKHTPCEFEGTPNYCRLCEKATDSILNLKIDGRKVIGIIAEDRLLA